MLNEVGFFEDVWMLDVQRDKIYQRELSCKRFVSHILCNPSLITFYSILIWDIRKYHIWHLLLTGERDLHVPHINLYLLILWCINDTSGNHILKWTSLFSCMISILYSVSNLLSVLLECIIYHNTEWPSCWCLSIHISKPNVSLIRVSYLENRFSRSYFLVIYV